jgi:2-keto-4-pentenoate hydratase/2-oxohepta-3-ene-1,7-dioic acid hydratase in catechol pathway
MRVGVCDGALVAWSEERDLWVEIGDEWGNDLLAFLGGGKPARARARELLLEGEDSPPPRGLPFVPRSYRGVMAVESHYVSSARTMVRRFMPAPVWQLARGYELLTRRTFPALLPKPRFYEVPCFYFGNHNSFVADGERVRRPSVSRYLDFELELGAIVTQRWDSREQGVPRAADVIGGFTVIDDFSARDVQFSDERRSPFGGVVKAKSFATGIGAVVVSADEILERWDALSGRVHVNGELWCEGSTAGGLYTLDQIVGHIAADEVLVPGEVISLGTLAGCCGLELDRFLTPGDVVHLELDGIGTLTNVIAA